MASPGRVACVEHLPQHEVIDRDAEKPQPDDQDSGHGAGLEGDTERGLEPTGSCRLRGPHVGAHRDIHADIAGGAGKNGADEISDGGVYVEREAQDDADHHADHGDGAVLAVEEGIRPFLHRRRDLLHPCGAGVRGENRADRETPVDQRQDTANDHQPGCSTH